MKQITLSEYNAIHSDHRSVWDTERDDLPDWPEKRHLYMGKRTMMSGDGTCSLLIEGLSFEIIDDPPQTPSPAPWELQRLSGGDSTFCVRDAQNHCLAVVGEVDRATAPHNEANALLMVAAPDLLKALQHIDSNAAESVEWIRRVAREAISKATSHN